MAAKWAQKTVVIPAQRRGCHLITPKGHNAPWKHTMEGPDDMPAHIKSSMFGCALTIPITDGRLNMGTWQGAPPDQMGASYPHMFLILLLLHGANAASKAPAGPKWQTLSGRPPQVVARGGFSGLFPDSSQFAYQFALSTSLPDVVLFCDLQFSSDSMGMCKTGLTLDNSTTVSEIFPKMAKTYKVHGEDVHGWFSLDFTADQLIQNITLLQNIFSRPSTFDGSMGMYTLDDVVELHPPQIWLNVQYNSFFVEHKLSTEDYILGLPKKFSLSYISSTEIDFLKNLGGKLKKSNTKLIFRFLNEDIIESSTKKTYGELLKDLKSIKEFAAGILVPKTYIWPLNKDQYLGPSTSLVKDAHALGLEVYASGFANDIVTSYNYSYDPSAEYLQFIDNPDFSVDGVLTDFPPTASGAIACLAHSKDNPVPPPGKDTRPLIITHNGASGVYAGCTDLAYKQAIKDGADIIDCAVQMSKDGVVFCMHSADLSSQTTAATAFVSKSSTVHEIQNKSGIFSFDLSWSEIQTLKPDLYSPFAQAGLKRNPKAKNAGKFLTLAQFLDMAKASNVSGILLEIEHAPYLAKRGLGVVDAVSSALTKAGYDKEIKQQVFIQSDDSAVLSGFTKFKSFKRVLSIEIEISGASKPSLDDIKKVADGVRIHRSSVAQITGYFMTSFTDTVGSLQAANLSVFIGVLKNEFMNLGFDYFADPTVEIVTYSSAVLADGLVTDYPATAAAYFRSPCSDMSLNLSYSILPAQPGALVRIAAPGALAPAAGPAPVLEPKDVVDPPLPPVKAVITTDVPAPGAADNTTSAASSNAGKSLLGAGIAALLSLSFLH
ncbi:glycerophosphodiester phosphodiesterase GDPDL7-like [Panicum miliaceum]|uniref:glycerophosphodiester phosphodiesterase n=1 Tax=Panicum miliaceum TaxID=4540 RepID=A0A3L6QCE7_PANMI|nr:glycerophosphodiester phosphodiesterase GDPDL7-like [Panicum miliaceum]